MPIRSPDQVIEHRLSLSKNLQPLVKLEIKKQKNEVIQGYMKSGAYVGGAIAAGGIAYGLYEGLKWTSGVYDGATSWWNRRLDAAKASKAAYGDTPGTWWLSGFLWGSSEQDSDSDFKWWWS
jgi:hypothetical protein